MSEELQAAQQHSHNKQQRINLQELRNCDLVSRLLAATPPYLFSAPVGPNNYFFSEMLRSLVQARSNSDHANRSKATSHHIPAPPQTIRRSRKRLWGQHRYIDPGTNEYKDISTVEKILPEKPLELTNKMTAFSTTAAKYQKSESPKILTADNSSKMPRMDPPHAPVEVKSSTASYPTTNDAIQNQQTLIEPPAAEIPPSDLVLPPPPPMWYPPLYPPYGIDPLHFFIDLRVSGHIYDRKKENISPTSIGDNNNTSTSAPSTVLMDTADAIGKHRHGSAFSVPPPRGGRDKSPSALNLTFSTPPTTAPMKSEDFPKFFDNTSFDLKNAKDLTKNTNYVLQNLPKIYTNLAAQSNCEERTSVHSEETEESDAQDLDAKDELVQRCSPHDRGNFRDLSDVVIVDKESN